MPRQNKRPPAVIVLQVVLKRCQRVPGRNVAHDFSLFF